MYPAFIKKNKWFRLFSCLIQQTGLIKTKIINPALYQLGLKTPQNCIKTE